MLTRADIQRLKKDQDPGDLAKRIEDLEKQKEYLQNQCRKAGRAMIELNLKYETVLKEKEKLKKRAEEAEGEVTIVKGIGQNSPEMKALQAEVEKLKADLARAKEDHQYDNLVHKKELNERR